MQRNGPHTDSFLSSVRAVTHDRRRCRCSSIHFSGIPKRSANCSTVAPAWYSRSRTCRNGNGSMQYASGCALLCSAQNQLPASPDQPQRSAIAAISPALVQPVSISVASHREHHRRTAIGDVCQCSFIAVNAFQAVKRSVERTLGLFPRGLPRSGAAIGPLNSSGL